MRAGDHCKRQLHGAGTSLMMPAMIETIERLLALQDRDQKISASEAELRQIPEDRKFREKQLADSAARLEAAKTRLREIEVEKKNLEIEIETRRGQIDRYKTQQLQTRKNEEYSALAHEISTAEAAIRGVEDRELELMEEAEGLSPKIRAAESEYSAEKSKIDKAIELLEAKRPNIEDRLSELKAGRVTEGIDSEILEHYEHLFKGKSGQAVVALEHDVCTGCHMKGTNQTTIEVKSQKEIVHCPNCGRMLYFGET